MRRQGRPSACDDGIDDADRDQDRGYRGVLAAEYGARPHSRRLAIIGCGAQAAYQLEAVRAMFPVETIRVFDVDTARAEAFARAHSTAACAVAPASTVREATTNADICVTCTTSKSPVLTEDLDLTGCFVAAIGADNPDKQEIAPALLKRARILVDDIDACASGGDLNHALRAGAISKGGVHANLAELAAGRKRGRIQDDELVIFDSSGSGVQDVAAAWATYCEARRTGIGQRFDLSGAASAQ
jgi:alanine dehydrogenase